MLGHFAQSCVFICVRLMVFVTQTLKCSAKRRFMLLGIHVVIVEVVNNVIQVLRKTAGYVYWSSIIFFQSHDMWVVTSLKFCAWTLSLHG